MARARLVLMPSDMARLPLYAHVTAHVVRAPLPLHHPLVAPIVWGALRRQFPAAAAACLMPEHLHAFVLAQTEAIARRRLAFAIRGLARRRDVVGQIEWAQAKVKGIVAPGLKAARHARYVVLNPCRRGLVADPLEWAWSTHRDVVGAVVDPWVTCDALAYVCDRSSEGFRPWFHHYVCGDPSVAPDAVRLPSPVAVRAEPAVPLAHLRDASLSCTRALPDGLQRRGRPRDVFLALGPDQGWRHVPALAAACGISRRAVQKASRRIVAPSLQPARLCLGDDRLIQGLALPESRRPLWSPP